MTVTDLDVVEQRLAERGCNPRRAGETITARCPAHDDRNPSLSVRRGDRRPLLVHCHANCAPEAVLAALGLTWTDLPEAHGNSDEKPRIDKVYPYTDEHGEVLFEAVRFWPKDFRQRHPDGHGGHVWSLNGVRRVLYRLPVLRAAIAVGQQVWIVEGERDADNVRRAGVCATTSPMGAGKWRSEYVDQLAGATDVVIVADRDRAGRVHAATVYRSLVATVAKLVIVEAAAGKDATEHLSSGGALDEFVVVVDAPEQLDTWLTASDVADPSTNSHAVKPDTAPAPELLPDAFWSSRAALGHIRSAARCRMIAPDALLGAVLARLCVTTDWRVVIPPIIGRYASVNIDIGLVGGSGFGKGATLDTAADLLPWPSIAGHRITEEPVGSGEGIVKSFFGLVPIDEGDGSKKKIRTEWRQVHEALLVRVDEGEILKALGQRNGQTTWQVLRQAWSGERLGGAYAAEEKRLRIPAHTYRLALVIGIQPSLAGFIFDDVDGGTPQRFLWFATIDPAAPPPEQLPVWPGKIDRTPQRWDLAPSIVEIARSRRGVFGVDERIANEIRERRHTVINGTRATDELDTHEDLSRLKVAALLAVLDGRLEVNVADWSLAEMVTDTSAKVRDAMRADIAAVADRTEAARMGRRVRLEGAAEVERLRVVGAVPRNAKRLAQYVHQDGPQTYNGLRRWLASRDRGNLDAAIEHALGEAWITVDGDSYAPGESRPA